MINNRLKAYIETNILPKYEKNEEGHGTKHVEYVIRRSLEFAKQVADINKDMVYTIASYHDIGHHIDAKNHEIVSAEIFIEDENMHNFFDQDEMQTIYEAIQDHRASSDQNPRSVYGKIVSSADRRSDINDIMKTMYLYRLKHSPDLTIEENIEDAYKQLCKKFASGGYATTKMYFKDEEFEKLLEQAEWFKNNKSEFAKYYCEINNIHRKIC